MQPTLWQKPLQKKPQYALHMQVLMSRTWWTTRDMSGHNDRNEVSVGPLSTVFYKLPDRHHEQADRPNAVKTSKEI